MTTKEFIQREKRIQQKKRIQKFEADFGKLRRNREQVPLEELQGRYAKAYEKLLQEVRADADWFADAWLAPLMQRFPRSPKDTKGNIWLDSKINAILQEESRPGGLADQYKAALIDRLDWDEYLTLVWKRYDRLYREAFSPYWKRHCHWTGSPGKRRIYNDIWDAYWVPAEGGPDGGYWIGDNSGGRERWYYPPQIEDDPLTG